LPALYLIGAECACIGSGLLEKFSIGLEFVMAQVCQVCGKGPQFGNNISHAHNVSRRRWNVNLRPVKAKVEGGAKRLRVCTRCIKSGKVTKA
jgi:large subunit ribosomal protein L28